MTPQEAILSLLAERGDGKTICPSEAARRIEPADWRAHMDAVRAAAAELAECGRVEICQRGMVVNVREARGPIRLRLKRSP